MKKLFTKKTIFFAILIFLLALLGQPTAYGYLHPADAPILLAAMLLPTPSALLAAGAASVAADLFKGFYLLAPVTLVIKLLMVLLAKKLIALPLAKKHPELMAAPALVLPVLGYFLGELLFSLFQGGFLAAISAAIATLPKNLIQAGASILIFIFLYDIAMGIRAARRKIREEEEKKEEKIDE